jgi:sirohydrochlorin cobaltochelatase
MAADAVAAKHPNVEFLKAPYLNDHPAVVETFVERIEQIISGDIAMNCQMCKYRTAVLGFEAEVGAVQESHHHHVEGMSAKECLKCDAQGNCTGLCQDGPFKIVNQHHDHGHTHSHDDGHTHAIYPHADHPLGPKSMEKK